MHNLKRGAVDQERIQHSGPTEQGQNDPVGTTNADMQAVDFNHATAGELATIDGLEMGLAEAIVDYRVHHGHFASWDDVKRVPGMTQETLETLERVARIPGPNGAVPPAAHNERLSKP